MPRRRYAKHSEAFREEAVRQAREAHQSIPKLARDLGVHPRTLYMWVKDAETPQETSVSEGERGELRRLRKEVRELRMERDILKKATAFFAKHSK